MQIWRGSILRLRRLPLSLVYKCVVFSHLCYSYYDLKILLWMCCDVEKRRLCMRRESFPCKLIEFLFVGAVHTYWVYVCTVSYSYSQGCWCVFRSDQNIKLSAINGVYAGVFSIPHDSFNWKIASFRQWIGGEGGVVFSRGLCKIFLPCD